VRKAAPLGSTRRDGTRRKREKRPVAVIGCSFRGRPTANRWIQQMQRRRFDAGSSPTAQQRPPHQAVSVCAGPQTGSGRSYDAGRVEELSTRSGRATFLRGAQEPRKPCDHWRGFGVARRNGNLSRSGVGKSRRPPCPSPTALEGQKSPAAFSPRGRAQSSEKRRLRACLAWGGLLALRMTGSSISSLIAFAANGGALHPQAARLNAPWVGPTARLQVGPGNGLLTAVCRKNDVGAPRAGKSLATLVEARGNEDQCSVNAAAMQRHSGRTA
jgi:hypothetical protein